MSHFTAIKTQIKDTDALIKALADMGLKLHFYHFTIISVPSCGRKQYTS